MVAPRGWSATRAIPLLLVLAAIIGIVLVFVRTPTEPVIATRVTVSGGAAPATEDLGAAEASEPEHSLHDAATITAASQHEQQGQEEEEDRSPADASVLGGLVGVRHRNPFDTAVAITSHDGHAKALNELTLSYLDSAQALPPSEHPIPPHLTPEPVHAAMQRWFPGCRYSLLPQEPPEPPVAIEVRPVLHVFLRVPKWVSLSWTHCDTRRAVVVPEPLPPAELVLTSVWLTYLSCPPASAGQPNTTADFEWSFCLPLPSARDGPKARPWSVVYCREAQYSTGLQMRMAVVAASVARLLAPSSPHSPVQMIQGVRPLTLMPRSRAPRRYPSFRSIGCQFRASSSKCHLWHSTPSSTRASSFTWLRTASRSARALLTPCSGTACRSIASVLAARSIRLPHTPCGRCRRTATRARSGKRSCTTCTVSARRWRTPVRQTTSRRRSGRPFASAAFLVRLVTDQTGASVKRRHLTTWCFDTHGLSLSLSVYWGDSTLLKRQVPPRSVIFIDDFAANHTALFEHIKALGADRELYESYHAWRYNPPKAFLEYVVALLTRWASSLSPSILTVVIKWQLLELQWLWSDDEEPRLLVASQGARHLTALILVATKLNSKPGCLSIFCLLGGCRVTSCARTLITTNKVLTPQVSAQRWPSNVQNR